MNQKYNNRILSKFNNMNEITIEDCPYMQLFIPNSFTPNQDNHNETFYVHGADGNEIESMIIYNILNIRYFYRSSNHSVIIIQNLLFS